MNIFLIVLYLLGTPQSQESSNDSFEVFFFFNPDCPVCVEVEPIINYYREEYELRILRFNTQTPVGFRYAIQNAIQYVPTMIFIIDREGEKDIRRFEGYDGVRNAEKLIAELKGRTIPRP